ncbi:MAG: GNAT family N-acetyltransferase, partial [Rhodocyclales bacterium]|nr:GNAT family N-acetyltransferase [Rhodocyclales bacterium]
PEWRGKGTGRALLECLLDEAAARGMRKLLLNAQTAATGFYARFGFRPEGAVFMEAGIPHVLMTRSSA